MSPRCISLLVFHATANLNLHNILVTPTLVKIVITNLDLSKVYSSDCILVVALKNCESQLSYIFAELFIMKVSCFPYSDIAGRPYLCSLY